MQKQAFKIMGALLVLVLAVSFSVGAVSAYTIADEDYVPLDIMEGTPVLTKDIPEWGSTEPLGHYLNAETVYGALRTGSTDQYITYTANIDFDTGSYTIADIAGYEAVNGYVWRAFKDGNYVSDLRTTIADGAKVVFLLTTDTTTSTVAGIGNGAVDSFIAYEVNVVPTQPIWAGTLTFDHVPTALEALALAANTTSGTYSGFEYTINTSWGYAWLEDLDGYNGDGYSQTGYDWGMMLNNNGARTATGTLDAQYIPNGQTFEIWFMPSAYGGVWSGHTAVAADPQYGGGYYMEAAKYKVTITVNVNASA